MLIVYKRRSTLLALTDTGLSHHASPCRVLYTRRGDHVQASAEACVQRIRWSLNSDRLTDDTTGSAKANFAVFTLHTDQAVGLTFSAPRNFGVAL